MTSDLFDKLDSRFTGYKGKPKPRCHTTHKELEFGKGVVLGASCGVPRKGYDIYIGFDYGMQFDHTGYPWEQKADPVIEFQFRIPDMGVPSAPAKFKKMIAWICVQLKDGKKIHMGCIGGHGRTGMVIAAIKNMMDGEKDAISWARKHHCKKSVESKSQVNFLHKHFGITKRKPTKTFPKYEKYTGKVTKGKKKATVTSLPVPRGKSTWERIPCLKDSEGSIWG